MTGETAGQNLDDTTITTTVKSKLAADRAGSLADVSVRTVTRTVYLTGTVHNAADKSRAGSLAAGVSGVQKVVNELNVQP